MSNGNAATNHDCKCSFCSIDLAGKIRYDGATRTGIWGVMCGSPDEGGNDCFHIYGLGLGIGRGQKFDAQGRCIDGNRVMGGRIPNGF